MTEEKPRNLSLVEKVAQYKAAMTNLRKPVSDDELKEMEKSIADHIPVLLDRIKIATDDAKQLKDEAKKLMEAAKQQENEAKRIKDYIKNAMEMNNLKSHRFGRIKVTISKSDKRVFKRAPTAADYRKSPNIVRVLPKWSREATIDDIADHRDLIDFDYEWNEEEFKKLADDDPTYQSLLETQTTKRLLINVAKKEMKNESAKKD